MKRQRLIAISANLLLLTVNISAQNQRCDALTVKEYARYHDEIRHRWAVLLVPPKTSRAYIVDLIRKLHQQEHHTTSEFVSTLHTTSLIRVHLQLTKAIISLLP